MCAVWSGGLKRKCWGISNAYSEVLDAVRMRRHGSTVSIVVLMACYFTRLWDGCFTWLWDGSAIGVGCIGCNRDLRYVYCFVVMVALFLSRLLRLLPFLPRLLLPPRLPFLRRF
jgi:hypothetical protein